MTFNIDENRYLIEASLSDGSLKFSCICENLKEAKDKFKAGFLAVHSLRCKFGIFKLADATPEFYADSNSWEDRYLIEASVPNGSLKLSCICENLKEAKDKFKAVLNAVPKCKIYICRLKDMKQEFYRIMDYGEAEYEVSY